jgi:hypothetical protein
VKRSRSCRRTAVRRCGALVAPRARAGRPILGRWSPGEVFQQAQQAVDGGLLGGAATRNKLAGGLLHSSCWCACQAFRHCARCIVLSLSCVCAASLSRAAIIDDLRPQPDSLSASMDIRAILSAGELLAGARLGISHAERPRAKPAQCVWCAQTVCSIEISLWVRQGTLEPCLLHGVRSACR